MSWFKKVLSSSIGMKLAVGLSGLGLVGFLIAHAAGNLNLYRGTHALDEYAMHLHALPGFTIIEIGLLVMFLVHIPLVIALARSNAQARGSRYAVSGSKREGGRAQSLASRMMKVSGILLLIFIVFHVMDFRRERHEFHMPDGSVYGLGNEVIEALSNPLFAVIYIVGSMLAAWHVFHGFQSAFRSLGFNHGKYTPALEKLGIAIAVFIGLAFASIPVAIQVGMVQPDDGPPAAHADALEVAHGEDAEAATTEPDDEGHDDD